MFDELQQKFGHQFRDIGLLELALTHRSCGSRNNERMEFLGDAILNYETTRFLFHHFPTSSEGNLTRIRAGIVRESSLARIGKHIGLQGRIRIMRSADQYFAEDSVIADAFEAMLAAVLLDAGEVAAAGVVRKHVITILENQWAVIRKDAKSALQELLQCRGLPRPVYQLLEDRGAGPGRQLRAACVVEALAIRTQACAATRKEAEQLAAASAMQLIGKR